MAITVNDLRRAILASGDISQFAELYHLALHCPPIDIVSNFETPLALQQSTPLLSRINNELPEMSDIFNKSNIEGHLSFKGIDLQLIALAPYGKNAGSYLEYMIDKVKPDIIAVDAFSIDLRAHMLYSYSLPCAVGLPIKTKIVNTNTGQNYPESVIYPGNILQTAIIKSWLSKTPLLPIGRPPEPIKYEYLLWSGDIDIGYTERSQWKSRQYVAYHSFNEALKTTYDIQRVNSLAMAASLNIVKTLDSSRRLTVVEEACYLASRIADVDAWAETQGRKIQLLAIVDITHYSDIVDIISAMHQGVIDETYVLRKADTKLDEMFMVSQLSENLTGVAEEVCPETTLAQELFRSQLDSYIKDKDTEVLSESRVHELITKIVEHTRIQPNVIRGVSVRGTIAFEEILRGLAYLHGDITQEILIKAAMITLPPRLSLKQKGNENTVISDIVKEILYGIRFHSRADEAKIGGGNELSTSDTITALNQFDQTALEQGQNISSGGSPAVVSDIEKEQETIRHLEDMDYIKKDNHGQYSLTDKALSFLLNELEKKLRSGEISLDMYDQQKARLMQQMSNVPDPQFNMPTGELAKTIMEMMDAQDKLWDTGVNFNMMHVYYHIKENCEKVDLSLQKRDYYALRRLIDDLWQQKILVAAEKAQEYKLSGLALDILLRHLIDKNARGNNIQAINGFVKAFSNERKHEVRRYSSGDTFRDISVRHTLKEIVRHGKQLSDVRNSDFRVFLKQPNKAQSDIILCLDTSGSMGFNQRLLYARMVAAGLVHAVLRDGNRLGVVAFDDYGQSMIPLTNNDKEALLNFIAGLTPRGNTNIGDGIKSSRESLLQEHSRNQKHIILISDGLASAISESAFNQLKVIKGQDLTEESALIETRKAIAEGVKVSVVHIARKGEPSDVFINNLVRFGKGSIYRIGDFDDIKAILR
jgi:Mg-chelatase subunit ChlD